jgi:hypothetical protein
LIRGSLKGFCILPNDTAIKILASPPGGNAVDFASEIQASSEFHIELSSKPDLSLLIERVNHLLDTKDAA